MKHKKSSVFFLAFSLVLVMTSLILFSGGSYFGGFLTLGFAVNFIGFSMDPEVLPLSKSKEQSDSLGDPKKKQAFYVRMLGSLILILGGGVALYLS